MLGFAPAESVGDLGYPLGIGFTGFRNSKVKGLQAHDLSLVAQAVSPANYILSRLLSVAANYRCLRASSSSGVRGQSSRSNRESARSANRRPPIWQEGQ